MSLFSSLYQLLDFSPILMTGNELNPGDHLGGSEPQNHQLELRKVSYEYQTKISQNALDYE